MKKYIALITLMISASAFGWNVVVVNKTGKELMGRVLFGGAGICAPKNFLLPNGKTTIVKTGACCMHTLWVSIDGGTKWHHGDPSGTGLGLSCLNNLFEVKLTEEGNTPVVIRKTLQEYKKFMEQQKKK